MIDLQPSSEQVQIIDSVSGLLANRLPVERLLATQQANAEAEANQDYTALSEIGELGVLGLGLSEEQGGFGYSLIEEVLVAREFGRFLVSPGIMATMLAVHLVARPDEQVGATEFVQSLKSGAISVALAVAVTSHGHLEGNEFYILDGVQADWVLVVDEFFACLVPRADWQERRAIVAIDPSVTLERAQLGNLIGSYHCSDASLVRRARLLASAYLVGIAEAAQESSVAYVKIREQFGQPIGAFQSVKHRCADMLTRSSAAWSLTLFASLSEESRSSDADFQVMAAKIIAGDSASRNAAVNIQNHGGIGFTREHHAHLFVKRAHMFDLIAGSSALLKMRLLSADSPLRVS